MFTVRARVKFRAFFTTFGTIDETFTIPIPVLPQEILDVLIPAFTDTVWNKNGITLTFSFKK